MIMHVHEEDQHKEEKLFPPSSKILFYRGAWEDWPIEVVRYFVPISPMEMENKIESIMKHQSQKDSVMYPGEDKREFWERVKERNRHTAETLSKLGFTDYEGI